MKTPSLKRGKKLYPLMCEVSERLVEIRRILEADTANDDGALAGLKSSWRDSVVDCETVLASDILTLLRLLPPKDLRGSNALEREMREVLVDIRKLLTGNITFYSVIPEMVKPQVLSLSELMKKYAQL